jgi:hypothetical protein
MANIVNCKKLQDIYSFLYVVEIYTCSIISTHAGQAAHVARSASFYIDHLNALADKIKWRSTVFGEGWSRHPARLLRGRARKLSVQLSMESEFVKLNKIISALRNMNL